MNKTGLCLRSIEGNLTRLLAVAISAFRMSGSYLLEEDDLEFTVGQKTPDMKRAHIH